jgi:hypothetical protein
VKTDGVTRPDREQYIAKARKVLHSWANLVEIDLLRGGPPIPWLDMPDCDYRIVVSRRGQRPRAQLWPIRLREPLPTIPIPLRPEDADARLDLQSLVHHVHDLAGYRFYIYEMELEPPLSEKDVQWTREVLTASGAGK